MTQDSLARPPARRAEASAAAKLILCGEHAVVYGRPAIAIPVSGVRARAVITATPAGSGITIDAADLEQRWALAEDLEHPISDLLARLLETLRLPEPDARITITSDIPLASGMGSGAAVATAAVRGLSAFLGATLGPEQVSALVYESERRFHGTPSGIDNTVIAYERPVWFVRGTQGATIEPIRVGAPLRLLIGDTGVRSATRLPVAEVRRRHDADPSHYNAMFDTIGEIVRAARTALAIGDTTGLGALLDRNHTLLSEIGVSSPELDRLVDAARTAGALGAKLSGAGWGGAMIALVTDETLAGVETALRAAGAARVLRTQVEASDGIGV